MSPEPIARLSGHRGRLEIVCLSPDDKLLATGCRGGDLKIWSIPEFKELVTLIAPLTQ
ncbi:MAG: WD40 repeat domain-containing protein [Thermoguttaceae bacterium]